MAHRNLAGKVPAARKSAASATVVPGFQLAYERRPGAGLEDSAGPCWALLSRTGTTAGNPSATSTQLPPS